MKNTRMRWSGLIISFIIGLIAVYLYHQAGNIFVKPTAPVITVTNTPMVDTKTTNSNCDNYFSTPREIVEQLTSEDELVRHEIYRRIAKSAGKPFSAYSYPQEMDYPQQAEHPFIRFTNLDQTPEDEAIITFTRDKITKAVILKRSDCGWQVIDHATLPTSLLETVSAIDPGTNEVLVHEAYVDYGVYGGYSSSAWLYKLINGRLKEVARFPKELIQRSESPKYRAKKYYREHITIEYTFNNRARTSAPFIQLYSTRELVRYTQPFHWTSNDYQSVRTLEQRVDDLYWYEEEGVFRFPEHACGDEL